MAETLGILVSSDQHLEHVLGLCDAARASGRQLVIFLTSRGVQLTQHPRFPELEKCPDVSLCNVGFEHQGLQKPVPVVTDDNFATQMRHAMLIEDCDRYLVM